MSGQRNVEYHLARAAAERRRAEQAADAPTAALHLELARLHLMNAGEVAEFAHADKTDPTDEKAPDAA